MKAEVLTMDLAGFLRRIACGNWEEEDVPSSGVGVDYWFFDEEQRSAYINIDQDNVTVTVEGEVVWFGSINEKDAKPYFKIERN